jgi:hypothetical protein
MRRWLKRTFGFVLLGALAAIAMPVGSPGQAHASPNEGSSAEAHRYHPAASHTTSLAIRHARAVQGYDERTHVSRGGLRASAGFRAAKGVAPAKRSTGTTVLGHYPEDVKASDTIGARRFDVPEAAWKRMSPDEQWAANRRFLDRTIARGDDIELATPVDRARPGSFFERELRYLGSRGFRPNQRGDHLIAPGG